MSTITQSFVGPVEIDVGASSSVLGRYVASVGRSWRRARLRERLALMSAEQLLDIAIAEDELDRVWRREVFTPRAWAAQGVRLD